MAKRRSNDGKILEGKVRDALVAYVESSPALFHRFYDTTCAGSYLPAQPGDFMLLVPARADASAAAILLECKSTDAGCALMGMLTGDVAKRQIAKHRLWHRAGHPSLYIWLDLGTNEVEIYCGRQVVAEFLDKTKGVWPAVAGDVSNLLGLLKDAVGVLARMPL